MYDIPKVHSHFLIYCTEAHARAHTHLQQERRSDSDSSDWQTGMQ